MRAIVIGLGSMGRRRIRLLQSVDKAIEITGVDTQESRRAQAENELEIKTASSLDAACEEGEDIAFISTSPLSHASIIKECLEHSLHVFTEINLVDTGYNENMALAKEKDKVLFLSSTLLYRKEVLYIKDQVGKCNTPLTYIYHTGQYLPDWHPWESYKEFFVGRRETNGCRELMAIEFPWLFDVFGGVKNYYAMGGRQTTLDIDFNDNYQIMFEHESGHKGMLNIDVVSRKACRNFELSGEKLYLAWDGTPQGVNVFDTESKKEKGIHLYDSVEKRDDYSASIIEDAYTAEIENFLDVVKGRDAPRYSFEKDKKILKLIDKIEGSNQK